MLQFTIMSQSIHGCEMIEGQVEREEDGAQDLAAAAAAATTAAVVGESSSVEVDEDGCVFQALSCQCE